MKNYRSIVILANLLLVLFLINYSACGKEEIKQKGNFIFLELAPVDPRAFMKGDYMELNYAIFEHIQQPKNEGYIIVKLSEKNIGEFVRTQSSFAPINEREYPIYYSLINNRISINAEVFYFQEGSAEKYEKAKYGGIKVSEYGAVLLENLYDEDFKVIK